MSPVLIRILYKIANAPLRLRDWLYCRSLYSLCNANGAQFTSSAKIFNEGTINIGTKSLIMGTLIADEGATLEIGSFCYIGPDTIIHAHHIIEIGNDVQISHRVFIED